MISLFLPFAVLALSSSQAANQSVPIPVTNDPIAITHSSTDSGQPVCYRMRTYIFERNDGDAPKLVRETTCGPARPRLHQSKTPKARFVPAN